MDPELKTISKVKSSFKYLGFPNCKFYDGLISIPTSFTSGLNFA